MPATRVNQLDGWARWSHSPAVPPLEEHDQHRPQIASFLGQLILPSRGVLLVRHSLEDSVYHEPPEAYGQYIARDPEALLKLVESAHASKRIPENQEGPPLAYDLEAASDRAIHGRETGSSHASSIA